MSMFHLVELLQMDLLISWTLELLPLSKAVCSCDLNKQYTTHLKIWTSTVASWPLSAFTCDPVFLHDGSLVVILSHP